MGFHSLETKLHTRASVASCHCSMPQAGIALSCRPAHTRDCGRATGMWHHWCLADCIAVTYQTLVNHSYISLFMFPWLYHVYTRYRLLCYWSCPWVSLDEVNRCIHIAVFSSQQWWCCKSRSATALSLQFMLVLSHDGHGVWCSDMSLSIPMGNFVAWLCQDTVCFWPYSMFSFLWWVMLFQYHWSFLHMKIPHNSEYDRTVIWNSVFQSSLSEYGQ